MVQISYLILKKKDIIHTTVSKYIYTDISPQYKMYCYVFYDYLFGTKEEILVAAAASSKV